LLLFTLPITAQAAAGPDMVLSDLWDSPHLLKAICAGRPTLFFVCDTEASVCREGAVFFDARADDIEAHGFRAALIFIGPPAEVREIVLRTGIAQPVYVDPERKVFGALLDEEILPALVLADGGGRHVRTMYGGGESLEGNIGVLLEEGGNKGGRWWLVMIAVVVTAAAVLVFVVD
jgi:hypothetical protein